MPGKHGTPGAVASHFLSFCLVSYFPLFLFERRIWAWFRKGHLGVLDREYPLEGGMNGIEAGYAITRTMYLHQLVHMHQSRLAPVRCALLQCTDPTEQQQLCWHPATGSLVATTLPKIVRPSSSTPKSIATSCASLPSNSKTTPTALPQPIPYTLSFGKTMGPEF